MTKSDPSARMSRTVTRADLATLATILGGKLAGQGLLSCMPCAALRLQRCRSLRGRGGAGFPAGVKWSLARKSPGAEKYVICNADEGDSGTFSDRMIMEGDPFSLIEGMTIAGVAVGATKGFVYIRSEYPHAFRAMNAAIDVARDKGLLGLSVLGGLLLSQLLTLYTTPVVFVGLERLRQRVMGPRVWLRRPAAAPAQWSPT